MKVVKFGGSSLASASQLEKVLNIVKSDKERRFVVVSAPGKRNSEDTKVTDALIKYYRDYVAGNDISVSQSWIIDRYAAMVSELGLKPTVLEKISKSIPYDYPVGSAYPTSVNYSQFYDGKGWASGTLYFSDIYPIGNGQVRVWYHGELN